MDKKPSPVQVDPFVWRDLLTDRDRLRAALAESERVNFALAADQCHHGYGDEGGSHRCKYQDEIARLTAALAEALRERDEAIEKGQRVTHGLGSLMITDAALRARVEVLEGVLRDARPFCLGLGEGFWEGCEVAQRIVDALAPEEKEEGR